MEQRYAGLFKDENGGMTNLGQIVKDGWVFSLIPDTEVAPTGHLSKCSC